MNVAKALNTSMLTPKEIVRLDNTHYMTEQIHWYWHNLRDKQLTDKQTKLLKKLAYMTVAQQREYVIIEDELVKTPHNRQIYIKKSGKWEKTDKKYPIGHK